MVEIRTRLFWISSNLFSAAVFLSVPLLLAMAGVLRPLPDGDADFVSSSLIARSNACTRSSSGETAFSLSFFDFFFLQCRQHTLQGNAPQYSLLHNSTILDTSLELEGATWTEVVVGGHRPRGVVVVQVMEWYRHASRGLPEQKDTVTGRDAHAPASPIPRRVDR